MTEYVDHDEAVALRSHEYPRAVDAEQPAARKLPTTSPIEWHGERIPDREWIVAGLIPMRSVTLLGGDGGLGKSILMQQLLTACSLGKHWLGFDVTQCKCLGVFAEDESPELMRRQSNINVAYECDFADLEGLEYLIRVAEDNALVSVNHDVATPFYNELVATTLDCGAQLLVLDSLHDFFAGDENNRVDAHHFLNRVRRIAIDINGAVVICAHPPKAGNSGYSGSTAWNNTVRSRLHLTRSNDEEAHKSHRILRHEKSNYAALQDDIELEMNCGVFELRGRDSGGVSRDHMDEAAFLECLDARVRQGFDVCPTPNSPNAPRNLMLKMSQAGGMNKSRIDNAMNRLLNQGAIELAAYGPPSRNKKRILRATG